MRRFWSELRGSFVRVIPACFVQAQAVAFNMFLSFFPVLLLALGILQSSYWLKDAIREIPYRLQQFLPPGSGYLVTQFLERLNTRPWKLIALGLGGIFLVGTQVMMGLTEGFRIAFRDPRQPPFLKRYLHALLMLGLTIVPWLATVVFTVFAKQAREWIIHQGGQPVLVRIVWLMAYYVGTLVVGSGVLVVVYRVSQPRCRKWVEVVPGAILATVLWWMVNAGFGFYYRHMPYNLVYGSLAVVVGLMVWMYFTALVLMTGAAFNAEVLLRAGPQACAEESSPEIYSALQAGAGARRAAR